MLSLVFLGNIPKLAIFLLNSFLLLNSINFLLKVLMAKLKLKLKLLLLLMMMLLLLQILLVVIILVVSLMVRAVERRR